MRNRKGTNQYKIQYRIPWTLIVLFSLYFLAVIILGWRKQHPDQILSPLADNVWAYSQPEPTPKEYTYDEYIDVSCNKYEKQLGRINRCKALIHFLSFRESGYGHNKNCGDSGKACGPLQYHEPTYKEYRKLMIKQGHVTKIGSRLEYHDAIETTAWAISTGREKAWGPYLRGEIQL